MSRRVSLRRFLRLCCRKWLIAAILAAVARFLMLLSVLFLTSWSYTVWGNPESPLRHLLLPACFLAIGAVCLNMVARRLLRAPARSRAGHPAEGNGNDIPAP